MTPDLRLAFVGYEAMLFSVRAWHYSCSLPASRRVGIGAWEAGRFIGCLIFSRGACQNIGRPFGLWQDHVAELTRIALGQHATPTSRVLAIAVRLLRRHCPDLRLIVSYADPAHGHDGRGTYVACGWVYAGLTHPESLVRVNGRLRHPRSVGSRYGCRDVQWLQAHVDPDAARVATVPKHRYLFPLDDDMRAQVASIAQRYPTRERSIDSDALGSPPREGGARPTRSLHHPEARHA